MLWFKLLPLMRKAGSDVMGVDWRIRLDEGWNLIGHDMAIQGNLDPMVLFASEKEIGLDEKVTYPRGVMKSIPRIDVVPWLVTRTRPECEQLELEILSESITPMTGIL